MNAGFRLNMDKCIFFQEKIKYLGHVIDKDGLHKDADKVKAITEAPEPSNQTQVKALVGLVNYYSKFAPNLAHLLHPIYQLLRKNVKFNWNPECKAAFNEIKSIMASERVLTHYNPKLPIKLVCDASQYGIGAAIFHVFENSVEKPICFASHCPHRNKIIRPLIVKH